MEHEFDTVYYNYWSRATFSHMVELCERLPDLYIERYIDAISIESNNKSFLDYYREHYKIKGDKYCDMWLRGMLVDYVKRCSRRDNDAPYHRRYYEDWLNNTRWIANEFPELIKWCDEYEQWLPDDDTQTQQSVNVPGDHKRMEWCDLSELREAASSYYRLLTSYSFTWNDQDTNARINRLHDAIANIKINEIGDVLERFNVNQSLIINEVENIISIVELLIGEIGMKMPKVKPYDPGVAEVFNFCNELRFAMTIELTKLRNRYTIDPTIGDDDAGQRLMSYLNGDYGDMDFRMFYNNYLIPDGDYYRDVDYSTIIHARRRRLIYLIGICTDDGVKDIMIELLRGVQHEIDVHNNAVPEPEQPTPSAGNEQAAEATDTPDVAQFTPTIAFDMSALYEFLVDDRVIDDKVIMDKVSSQQFNDCINQANMNVLWEICGKLRKRNQMRCVIRYLKDHFEPDWLSTLITNGLPKNIISFNRDTLGDFENKVRELLL